MISLSNKRLALIIPILGLSEPVTQVLSSFPSEKLLSLGFETTAYIVYTPLEETKDPLPSFLANFPVEVLIEPKKGYGQAYLTAFAKIKADIFVCLDGDMTYPLFLLPKLISLSLSDNYLFLSTNRLIESNRDSFSGWNLVGNKLLSFFHHLLFHLPFRDTQSGFWLISSSLLDRLSLHETSFLFSSEIKLEAFLVDPSSCTEVKIPYFQRNVSSKSVNKLISGLNIGLFILKRFLKKKQK